MVPRSAWANASINVGGAAEKWSLAQSAGLGSVDARKILAAMFLGEPADPPRSWPTVDAERGRPSVPCR